MCECPVQGKGPKGLKTEAASSPGFGSRTPVSVTGLPGAPSQSQVSPEGLKEEAHLCTSRTVLSWDFPGGPVIKICTPSAGDMGSVPGWGTEIPHGKKKKKKRKKKKRKKKKRMVLSSLMKIC